MFEIATFDLGPCCACGIEERVGPQNLVCLPLKVPVPGTGWGNVLIEQPANGALAVLCDACLEAKREPVWAIPGYAEEKGRVLISELTEPFGDESEGETSDADERKP